MVQDARYEVHMLLGRSSKLPSLTLSTLAIVCPSDGPFEILSNIVRTGRTQSQHETTLNNPVKRRKD